jgi:hypothetical protein
MLIMLNAYSNDLQFRAALFLACQKKILRVLLRVRLLLLRHNNKPLPI